MSDTNDNDPQDRDLPGFSSHFSTTLTGLKPMRRRSRATTSTEVPPEADGSGEANEDPEVEVADNTAEEPTEEALGHVPPSSTDSLEVVHDEPEASHEDTPPEDPLAGIELRPGLSLVDTAEIPIHRAQAAAKLAKIREPEARPAPTKPASPPPPQRPIVRNKPPSRRSPPPAVIADDASSARLRPHRQSAGGFGWLYVGVIILIACLIGALVMQVKDLL